MTKLTVLSKIGEICTDSLTFSTAWLISFIPPTLKREQVNHRSIRELTRLDTKSLKDITSSILTVLIPWPRSSGKTQTSHLNPTESKPTRTSTISKSCLIRSVSRTIKSPTITTCIPPLTVRFTASSSTKTRLTKVRLRKRSKRVAVLFTTVAKVRGNTSR